MRTRQRKRRSSSRPSGIRSSARTSSSADPSPIVSEPATVTIERGAPAARPARTLPLQWLGLLPFFLFTALFLGAPLLFLALGSIRDNDTGAPTIANYASLSTPLVATAFRNSIEVSL